MTPTPAPSFWQRSIAALLSEDANDSTRSRFARDERTLLFADSPDAGRGVEFLVGFPVGARDSGGFDAPIELRTDGTPILAGVWQTSLSINGRPIVPEGEWETVCVDLTNARAFCERSVAASGGRRFTRRILYVYNESLLLLADELAPDPADRDSSRGIVSRAFFPFAPGARAVANPETRETIVATSEDAKANAQPPRKAKRAPRGEEEELLVEIESTEPPTPRRETVRARVFPIGLPEWRADASRGEFSALESAAGLELKTTTKNASLFAPLVFDFNVRRSARPCSWRTLAVGENKRVVGEDEAVGRRLQLGAEQYVLYASTSPRPQIRSILGRHLLSDFMFGKFYAARGTVPILDVELEDEN